MEVRKEFVNNYDAVVGKFCRPYKEFFRVGAGAIPVDVESVCDLGIGSGNFSVEVVKRIPGVEVYGIDLNGKALENAKVKIPDAILYEREFFDGALPKTDYVISSLATHHFSDDERLARFEQIVRNGKGFVNFDMFLMNGNSLNDSIDSILDQVRTFSSDEKILGDVAHEIRENDNMASLREQRELFERIGMKFDVLATDAPWAVYHVYWPSRKS